MLVFVQMRQRGYIFRINSKELRDLFNNGEPVDFAKYNTARHRSTVATTDKPALFSKYIDQCEKYYDDLKR